MEWLEPLNEWQRPLNKWQRALNEWNVPTGDGSESSREDGDGNPPPAVGVM